MNYKIKGVLIALFCLVSARLSFGYDLIADVEQNTVFTVGQIASAGTAINLRNGESSTSMLAEVADYRGILGLWWGGVRVNKSDANFTDAAKIGLDVSWIFSKFSNPLPPQALWLKNLSVGPALAMNLLTTPHVVTPYIDLNYVFVSK